MAFDIEMIKQVYANFPARVEQREWQLANH